MFLYRPPWVRLDSKKGIAGFNESQVDTGEINKKDSCDTHKHACTKKKEVVHPINSVIIY